MSRNSLKTFTLWFGDFRGVETGGPGALPPTFFDKIAYFTIFTGAYPDISDQAVVWKRVAGGSTSCSDLKGHNSLALLSFWK